MIYFDFMRHKDVFQVTEDERLQLEKWVRSAITPARLVLRSRVVLMIAEGKHDLDIAGQVKCSRHTVRLWRTRFLHSRINGITKDAVGRGRKPVFSDAKVNKIVAATLHSRPDNATHWSVRQMARKQNVSTMTVQRIWQRYNLKPHLVETFKLSNDPRFLEKLEDVVGLYLNPPDKALVLCFDEKSQIQALERTRPILPLGPGIPEKQTHDYKRHGTTTLFAALSMLDGSVIGTCLPRHRHQEFIKFLNVIDEATPKSKELHLIVDNYATHKHPKVKTWLRRHNRFHFHFTPTASSWLNLVERWFREITDKRIRRGSFANLPQLIDAINDFICIHNQEPKPFIWSAPVSRILEKIEKTKKCISDSVTPH